MIYANLKNYTLSYKEHLFSRLGLVLDSKELLYYDSIFYIAIHGELLTDNLKDVSAISPDLVSILSASKNKVSYYCYDDRIHSHRVLLSVYNDGQYYPFAYLLITNAKDFKIDRELLLSKESLGYYE